METVQSWRGRPIETLSREELIEAVHALGKLLADSNAGDHIDRFALPDRTLRGGWTNLSGFTDHRGWKNV